MFTFFVESPLVGLEPRISQDLPKPLLLERSLKDTKKYEIYVSKLRDLYIILLFLTCYTEMLFSNLV